MSFGAKVGNLGPDRFSDLCLCLQSRFVPRAPLRGKAENHSKKVGQELSSGSPSENGTTVTAADLLRSSGDSSTFFGRWPLDSRKVSERLG